MAETMTPLVRYETIDGYEIPYDISVNPSICGQVMSELGIPNPKIESTEVVVTPYRRDALFGEIRGGVNQKGIKIYGGSAWDDYSREKGWEDFDESSARPHVRFIYKHYIKRYLERQKTPLLERINEDLKATLLHEIQHVADNLDSRAGVIKSHALSLGYIVGGSLPYSVILANNFLPTWITEPPPVFAAKFIGAQLSALGTLVATSYILNPYEIRARSFANRASKNTSYDDLITFNPK